MIWFCCCSMWFSVTSTTTNGPIDAGYDSIALLQLAAACRKAYASHFPRGDADYLYKYTTPQGWGLANVMQWLIPYAHVPSAPWPFNQITPFDRSTYTMLFRLAANAPAWRDRYAAEFEALAEQQPGFSNSSIALTHPPTGTGW